MIDPKLVAEAPVVTTRMLRQFAALWLAVFTGLSAWSAFRDHDAWAVVFLVLAVTVGPFGLVRPSAIRPLFSGLTALTMPIGLVVTRLILVIVFHGLFTTVALLFRAIGRDALSRERPGAGSTYWLRRSKSNPRRYLRQY
jgi:hypothetical protein